MSCIIKLLTGNNQIEMEVPSLPSSYQELKQILSQNKRLDEFNSYIKSAISQGNIIKSQSLDTIISSSKIIPNTTAASLQSRFPQVEFPNIDLQKIPILLVNHYKVDDNQLQFGLVEQNGSLIYVLDNNIYHAKKLAAYLTLKQAIEHGDFLKKLSKKVKNTLDECRKASNYSSNEEMVLQYLNNKSIFRKFRTQDGKSVFSTLSKILTELGQIAPKKVQFSDETVKEFYERLTWEFEDSGKLKDIKISLSEFYEQVLSYDEVIKQVIPDTFDKFYKFINSDQSTEAFDNLFGETSNKVESIINYLNSREPWLNLGLIKFNKNTISLKQLYPTVSRVYGIGYDTIKSMTFSNYKGWYIFENNRKFYPSKNFITPNTKSIEYTSLEEAQQFIESNVLNDNLFELDDIQTGRSRVVNNYNKGDLIRLKSYEVSDINIKNENERKLQTLQDFYNYFNNPEIQNLIQTAEEATLFLRKINEFSDRSLQRLIQIAQEIHDAPYTYYYVEDSYKDNSGNKYQRVIPAKGIQLEEFKSNHKLPVLQLFNAIQQQFGNKFGIQIEVLTNDEIQEQYNITGAKAFLIGDKIVLNSTLSSSEDLFHEYSHIVLGYLKQKNPTGYRNLIQEVWNNKNFPTNTRNIIESQYKDLPMESKMEEGFVYEFGKYISNGLINEDLSKIFAASENMLQEGVSSIFDGETDIAKIFGGKLSTIFGRFNQEVGNLINSDNDFLSFSKSNDFFLQRKKVNWLEKQIESKNIIEKC